MAGWIMIGIGAVVVLFILFVTWAMNSRLAGRRGWVFNKHNPRPRGAGTLGLLESIYQPSIEHVIEERSSERARGSQDESGERPDPGGGNRAERSDSTGG
jgi:hypothetical protein